MMKLGTILVQRKCGKKISSFYSREMTIAFFVAISKVWSFWIPKISVTLEWNVLASFCFWENEEKVPLEAKRVVNGLVLRCSLVVYIFNWNFVKFHLSPKLPDDNVYLRFCLLTSRKDKYCVICENGYAWLLQNTWDKTLFWELFITV